MAVRRAEPFPGVGRPEHRSWLKTAPKQGARRRIRHPGARFMDGRAFDRAQICFSRKFFQSAPERTPSRSRSRSQTALRCGSRAAQFPSARPPRRSHFSGVYRPLAPAVTNCEYHCDGNRCIFICAHGTPPVVWQSSGGSPRKVLPIPRGRASAGHSSESHRHFFSGPRLRPVLFFLRRRLHPSKLE